MTNEEKYRQKLKEWAWALNEMPSLTEMLFGEIIGMGTVLGYDMTRISSDMQAAKREWTPSVAS